MRILVLAALLFGSLALVGCSSTEASPTPDNKSATNTPSDTKTEMAKCDACGKEVAKATLVSHDGQMMCEACMGAHKH